MMFDLRQVNFFASSFTTLNEFSPSFSSLRLLLTDASKTQKEAREKIEWDTRIFTCYCSVFGSLLAGSKLTTTPVRFTAT
jgi:hypothetical protein